MPLYAASELTEHGDVPCLGGEPIAVRFRWIAMGPWWYFETEEPLVGFDLAPDAYPNGVPLLPCERPWTDPAEVLRG